MTRLWVLASFVIASVSAYRPGDEVCVVTKDNPCPVNTLTISKTDASTLIYPGGKTRCAFDDFTSPKWNTNATYFFQVFPKKGSKKLLLYFQMGGACLDDRTCSFATQCSLPRQFFNINAHAESKGVLNATNPNNVFRDWNVVHVPYCTGDIHIGNTVIPPKELNPTLIKDHCMGKNMTMHMNGYENTMSALNWAFANYPHPEHLVVAGSSAGALGAQYLAETIASKWKVQEKSIRYGVLADSYVGVAPTSTGTLLNYIGGCSVLPVAVQPSCIGGSATAVDIMKHILMDTSFSDWLHITSKNDVIQRLFAKLVELTHDPRLIISYLNPTMFFSEMNKIIMGEKSVSKRLSVFFVEGKKHVFLLGDDWYNTMRADTKEKFGDFVKKWLTSRT